jgi:hypothetical protein
MTEAEWLTGANPGPMLDCLFGAWSDRKARLFAAACCRRLFPLLTDERAQSAIEAVERFADGGEKVGGRRAARRAAQAVQLTASRGTLRYAAGAVFEAAHKDGSKPWVVRDVAHLASTAQAFHAGDLHSPAWNAAAAAERLHQAALLRDLFGNPFRPKLSVAPHVLGWGGGLVPKLARAVYDDRRFADLPILADALEEAGCADADVLAHCRAGGEHARGCWVVDLLLDKR